MVDIHPEHARVILGELALGLVLIDGDERVTWVNDYAAALLGMDASALLGRTITDLPLPYTRPDEGTQVRVDDAMIGITQRYEHQRGSGAILMTLDRGHALVWLLNALSSGVPATLAASGILSRSATAQRLEAEISRSRRYSNPLSCILVAARGVSEETMAMLARALKGQLRWVDQLGQWRDDMLLVLLPETDQAAARGLADKVRRSIGDLPPVNELPISIGCATWRRGEGAEQLVERARNEARVSGDPVGERRRR